MDFLGIFYLVIILLLIVSYQKPFIFIVSEALVRIQKIKPAAISNRLYILIFIITLLVLPKSIIMIPIAYIFGNMVIFIYRYYSIRKIFKK